MPQTCTVCAHPETKKIEQDIIKDVAHTDIAKKYGINNQSVRYHSIHHLPEKLVQSFKAKERKHARGILNGIEDLLDETELILKEARADGKNRLALDAIKEGRNTYELLSKIAVKLREYQNVEQQKKSNEINDQTSKGLEALSTPELKTLIQISAKVKAADPDYVLDHDTRIFVDSMNRMNTYSQNNSNNNNDNFDPDSVQNRPTQDKITQNNKSKLNQKLDKAKSNDEDPLQIDDLADFDLDDLSDSRSNVIPSEETDPDWRKE